MSKEFRVFIAFVREQGVVGLAVGLAIGIAAGASVKAIIDGLVSPIVGFILGGTNLSDLKWETGLTNNGNELVIYWGAIANSILVLLATALVIFYLVRIFRLDRLDKKKEKDES